MGYKQTNKQTGKKKKNNKQKKERKKEKQRKEEELVKSITDAYLVGLNLSTRILPNACSSKNEYGQWKFDLVLL